MFLLMLDIMRHGVGSHQKLMITVMDMVTSYVIVVYSNDTQFGTSVPLLLQTAPSYKNFLFSTLLIQPDFIESRVIIELIVIREDVVIVSSLKSKEGYRTEKGNFFQIIFPSLKPLWSYKIDPALNVKI